MEWWISQEERKGIRKLLDRKGKDISKEERRKEKQRQRN